MNTPRILRTRSVGTKLSEEEYSRVETAAVRRGLTVGEWSREVLLEAAGKPAPAATPGEEILLAEILALRTILLNLFYEAVSGEAVRPDRMQELIAKADGEKREKASSRFQAQHPEPAP
jgi:hypothetical protein